MELSLLQWLISNTGQQEVVHVTGVCQLNGSSDYVDRCNLLSIIQIEIFMQEKGSTTILTGFKLVGA